MIYLVSSSLILFQEILYNDRALGVLGFISHFFSAENGTLLRFSYEVNFWSVIFSQIFLFIIVILSFKWLSNKILHGLYGSRVLRNQVSRPNSDVRQAINQARRDGVILVDLLKE